MPTARQNQYIPPLTQTLGAIASINPQNLIQREKLGTELSFDFMLSMFVEIITAAQNLQKLSLERLPYTTLAQLSAPFQQIQVILDQIKNFSPSAHGNATQVRDSLGQQLEDQWGSIFQLIRSILGSQDDGIARREIDTLISQVNSSVKLSADAAESFRAKQDEIDKAFNKFFQERTEEFDKEGATKLKLIDKAIETVRNVAAEAGVTQTSRYFKEEAHEHLITSRLWLTATFFMIIALIAFSLWGTQLLNWLGTTEPALDAHNIIQIKYLAQKGLVVFSIIFALFLCVKNFGASRHNYVVNKHRNNALSSFQAFSTSASDEQTKNAVLIQATQSIFSPQPSGYVKTDGDNSPHSPIVEIMRSASKN